MCVNKHLDIYVDSDSSLEEDSNMISVGSNNM